ncbi:MAG: hypothetical protein JW768_05605 [Chitinispirillaceae bacterium]|nr:hypothetical protein [Chitinispirillaceae bacterium]
MRKKYIPVGICLIALTITVIFYGRIDPESATNGDLFKYIAMARAAPKLDASVISPFCFRMFGPFLVGLLPVSTEVGFAFLTIFMLLILVFVFYKFILSFGVSEKISGITVLLFVLNKYFFAYPAYNVYQVNDIIALLQLMLLYSAMKSNRWDWFGMVLVWAAFTRETAFIMAPVAFIHQIKSGSTVKKTAVQLLWLVPGFIALIGIRTFVPHVSQGSLVDALISNAGKITSIGHLYALFVNSFAPLTPLVVIFYKETFDFIKINSIVVVYVFLAYISTLFGSNDERLVAPVGIVFYPLIALQLQRMNAYVKGLPWLVLGLTFPTCFDYTNGRFLLPDIKTMYIISLISMGIISMVCLYAAFKEWNAKKPGWQNH